MRIKLQLKDIVCSDAACDHFGLNPWCVNEGADGDDWYELSVKKAKKFNLI
tara:strand:+ start:10892 stop:11044 length:153 start_codon:yes stop_codon:yes gene_type:complete